MLVRHGRHPRDCLQEFLYLLPEDSRTFPVDYPDARHSEHNGIIHIVHHLVDRIVQPLATDIYLRTEIQLPLGNRRVVLYRGGLPWSLPHRLFVFVGTDSLHLVRRNLGAYIADIDYNVLRGELDHFPYKSSGFKPDLFPYFQRGVPECFQMLLLYPLPLHLLTGPFIGLFLFPLTGPFPAGIELLYFTASDVTCDDVVCDSGSEISTTPAAKQNMLFDLLKSGLLYDENGKLDATTRYKILSVLGYGGWEQLKDEESLHYNRAERENAAAAAGENPQVSEIDDHDAHVQVHTRFLLSAQMQNNPDAALEEKIIRHIREHKNFKAVEAEVEREKA